MKIEKELQADLHCKKCATEMKDEIFIYEKKAVYCQKWKDEIFIYEKKADYCQKCYEMKRRK